MHLSDPSAKVCPPLDEHDLATCLRYLDGCREPRHTTANDEDSFTGGVGRQHGSLNVHGRPLQVRYFTGRLIIDQVPDERSYLQLQNASQFSWSSAGLSARR